MSVLGLMLAGGGLVLLVTGIVQLDTPADLIAGGALAILVGSFLAGAPER